MALKRIRSHGERTGVERTDVTLRRHRFTLDEPVAAGGTDTAPTPLEYVVDALNGCVTVLVDLVAADLGDRKSTRLNSSHVSSRYAVFCLKKKTDAQLEQI